jgi:uncharacterized glyoxalase superfamily protein PhnB
VSEAVNEKGHQPPPVGAMEVVMTSPYLRVKDAPAAIAFYVQVFGARERYRLVDLEGRVGHAELALGNATLMISEEYPELGILSPQSGAATGSAINLHVLDTDAMAARAEAAGATLLRPPADQFYGERACTLRDPFGHEWIIGHAIEDLDETEMQKRLTAILKGELE